MTFSGHDDSTINIVLGLLIIEIDYAISTRLLFNRHVYKIAKMGWFTDCFDSRP